MKPLDPLVKMGILITFLEPVIILGLPPHHWYDPIGASILTGLAGLLTIIIYRHTKSKGKAESE